MHFLLLFLLTRWIFQELDIAIVKATNHVERPAKEKHIRGNYVVNIEFGLDFVGTFKSNGRYSVIYVVFLDNL